MNRNRQDNGHSDFLALYRTHRVNRRAALALTAGLGLSVGGPVAAAASTRGGARLLAQTDATPAAPASPALGEQPDGTVTWHVLVGHMSMEEGLEAMAFFPDEITINAGDRIFYEFHSLHTVTFTDDQEPPPFIVPEAQALGTPVDAADDGSRYVLNPVAAFPSGPPVHTGAGYVNSGTPDPTVPPFVLEFTEPGTFDYICLVHPVQMKATVVVQEQGADRPLDQAAYDQQAAEQIEAILEQGRALVEEHMGAQHATPATGGGTVWEVAAGAGQDQVQVMRFLPDRLEISAGDTVRWTNHGITEPHTVTFPGAGAPPGLLVIEPQPAGPPLLVLNPPVMEPAGGPSYDGQSYANSGWLQEEESEIAGGVDFPHTWELTFEEPGEYPYYCVLHAGPGGEGEPELMGMVGTVVVS